MILNMGSELALILENSKTTDTLFDCHSFISAQTLFCLTVEEMGSQIHPMVMFSTLGFKFRSKFSVHL